MAQTEIPLPRLAELVEERIRHEMLKTIEGIILERVKATIRTLAQRVVDDTIGQARVRFEKDMRWDQLNISVQFPGVDNGN